MSLVALTRADIPELRTLLAAAFPSSEGWFYDPALLEWKYFTPRADWSPPRSWGWRDPDGTLVAHLGLWPVVLQLPSGPVTTRHGIDWASVVPHAGRTLWNAVLAELDATCRLQSVSTGGSASSRALFPRLGLDRAGSVATYGLPVRPWKQARTSPPVLRPRRVSRLVRNAAWVRGRPRRPAHGWSASHVTSFAAVDALPSLDATSRHDASALTTTVRTAALLDYLLAAPIDTSAHILQREGKPVGHVVFSHRFGQTRIAELRIASRHDDDWADAVALAIDIAASGARTCEVVAVGAGPTLPAAFSANGMRVAYERPLWIKDPHGVLTGAPPLELQADDSDAWFNGESRLRYAT